MKKTSSALRQCIGQLMIIGFDGTVMEGALKASLKAWQPGGIILFSRNIEDARQTWRLVRDCNSTASFPMFLCVDMEGGLVDRLKTVFAAVPSVGDVVRSGGKDLYHLHGSVIGAECRTLGFNVDFAPVLDLGFAASRPVLGSRTASDNQKKIVEYAQAFLQGLKSAKVLGCGKHFPGLGEAHLDTHKDLPTVSKPWKQLWNEDVGPYRALASRLPFVMVAHASYSAVTREAMPASLSKVWITDILRSKLKYKGLVIADDLEMGGVQALGSIKSIAPQTIRAGANIFLICHNQQMIHEAFEALIAEAERDRKFAETILARGRRILSFKRRTQELSGFPAMPSKAVISNVRESIAMLNDRVGASLETKLASR